MAKNFITAIEPFFRHKAVCLVDVGAHTGGTFELFAKSGLKIHEAHLFEPNPRSFLLLRQNLAEQRNTHRFYCKNKALGRSTGRALLRGGNDMTRVLASASPTPGNAPSTPETVEISTLDKEATLFALPRISILKIDVEGSEIDVLAGAQNLLEQGNIDVIYIEAGLDERRTTLTHYRLIEDFLQPLGFRIFRFFEQHHEWPDDSPLLRRTNIAFMREEFARAHPYRLTLALDHAEKKVTEYERELEIKRRQLTDKEQEVHAIQRELADSKWIIERLQQTLLEQTRKLSDLKEMLTFRLGKVIVDGSRSVLGVLLMPYRMLAVYREFRRERRGLGKQRASRPNSKATMREVSLGTNRLHRLVLSRGWDMLTGNPLRSLPHEEIAAAADAAHVKKDHISALILYTHLAESLPRIEAYRKCLAEALHCASREYGKPPAIDTKKTSARGKQLRLIHTLISLGYDKEKLLDVVKQLPHKRDRYALTANLHAGEDATAWEKSVNGLLRDYGLRGVRLKPPGFSPSVMQNIAFEGSPEAAPDRGLVTICISACNSAQTLPYAIESVLGQDYQNFELLILNDASSDGTGDVAEHFAAKDKRIVAIHNNRNRGTYWNRNQALARAKGIYFTVLDADDIFHPQRIPLQLDFLDQNPKTLGVFGLWFRVDQMGRLTYRNSWGGVIVHEAVATLVFRREAVTSRIGYYDPVKIASDTEYLERIKRVFGKETVPQIRKPLSIALAHPQSLTASHGFGIDNYFGLSQPRQDYREAWMRWHRSATPEQLFVPFPDAGYQRPFAAPAEILVPLD